MIRLALILVLLASSCATNRWNAYDTSSQAVVMDPTEQNYAKHIQLLETWAANTSQPMPPGLHAELAYWLAKVGRYPEADAALQRELASYPLANQFLTVLRSLIIPADLPKPAPKEGPAAAPTAGDSAQHTPEKGDVKP